MRASVTHLLQDEILTREEAALIIGVHSKTIWQWISEGTLPAVRIGGTWLIDRRDAEIIAKRYRNCGPSGKKCRKVGLGGE